MVTNPFMGLPGAAQYAAGGGALPAYMYGLNPADFPGGMIGPEGPTAASGVPAATAMPPPAAPLRTAPSPAAPMSSGPASQPSVSQPPPSPSPVFTGFNPATGAYDLQMTTVGNRTWAFNSAAGTWQPMGSFSTGPGFDSGSGDGTMGGSGGHSGSGPTGPGGGGFGGVGAGGGVGGSFGGGGTPGGAAPGGTPGSPSSGGVPGGMSFGGPGTPSHAAATEAASRAEGPTPSETIGQAFDSLSGHPTTMGPTPVESGFNMGPPTEPGFNVSPVEGFDAGMGMGFGAMVNAGLMGFDADSLNAMGFDAGFAAGFDAGFGVSGGGFGGEGGFGGDSGGGMGSMGAGPDSPGSPAGSGAEGGLGGTGGPGEGEQYGGAFTVGGPKGGPPDSQKVEFKASPGEQVRVIPTGSNPFMRLPMPTPRQVQVRPGGLRRPKPVAPRR